MFDPSVYVRRRNRLTKAMKSGLAIFWGNDESPMNYRDNPYHYRQDSSFLYYFGLDEPNLTVVIDFDTNESILFGEEWTIDDIIWMGPQPSLTERATRSGIERTEPRTGLNAFLDLARQQKRPIHYLPAYRPEHYAKLRRFLGLESNQADGQVSVSLIKNIVEQRSEKSDLEILEIEKAHAVTSFMHQAAMQLAKPGMSEGDIAGYIEGFALSGGSGVSYPVICSVHGEILHNHNYGNIMQAGDLLVNDSGAESAEHYAADITRTIPVSGTFTSQQKDVYTIVLEALNTSIERLGPGVNYRDIHLQAARIMADGLKALGLMRGDIAEAVQLGAHALFFPHGLGHMMGLDVHDMENLGEQYVGYDDHTSRSDLFGLSALRLAKALKPGFVLTVEPGLYFIPALIDLWKSEGKFKDFVNYDKLEAYRGFGGIRIEDNILITEKGYQILGKPIPKSIAEVEEACAGGKS